MTRSLTRNALDDVDFLARSVTRLQVLEALAATPCDRRELQEETGVSRATIGRAVTDFEKRGWVRWRGCRYELSPLGSVLVARFRSLLDAVETMRTLRDVLRWLPVEAFDFDIEHLADARLTSPTWSDPLAPVHRAGTVVQRCTHLRVAASSIAPPVVRAIRDAAVENGAAPDVVLTADALAVVETSYDMSNWLRETVDAGGTVYRHAGHRYLLATADGVAAIGVNDDAGLPRGLVESADTVVVEWVDTTIEDCRREAVPADPTSLIA